VGRLHILTILYLFEDLKYSLKLPYNPHNDNNRTNHKD